MPDNGQKKIAAQYARWARNYDRRWARYTERVLAVALDHMALTGTEIILDVACGTGELEHRIVRRFPQQPVIGIDLSEHMLAAARTKLAAFPHCQFMQGDSQHLQFPDRHFDMVVSCSALHYMRHAQHVIDECARVLKPGGRVLIIDWCRDYLSAQLYHIFRRVIAPAHHRVYTRRELETMFRVAGLIPTRCRTFAVWPWWRMMAVEAQKS